jgi:hypothetical protein
VQPTPVTEQEDEQISYPPKEGVRTLANACIPELSLVKSELCVFYFTAFCLDEQSRPQLPLFDRLY